MRLFRSVRLQTVLTQEFLRLPPSSGNRKEADEVARGRSVVEAGQTAASAYR